MRNIWTVAKREYRLYFISPVAYVVAFMILITLGIVFVLTISQASYQAYMYPSPPPDVGIITGPLIFLLMLSTPALTMRLLAEEQRMGTMELLLTAPLRDWELVIGKWLGSFLFVVTLSLVTWIYPIVLNFMVTPGIDQGLLITGYLGVLLASAAFLALGVAISSFFTNQIAAFFATFGLFVVLWWLIGFPADIFPTGGEIFRYLDMSAHFYDTLIRGIISLSDVTFYLSLTALGLFVGSVSVEMRRWR